MAGDSAPRPLAPDDLTGARALLEQRLGGTPYLDRALEVLEASISGVDAENRALVVERDGAVGGVVLYGLIAGTVGAARIHRVILAPSAAVGSGGDLLEAALPLLAADGARFAIAELPDDPAVRAELSLLRANGFLEEARLPDFYRDGIDLVFVRRDL
jgi:hypothetical protein